MSATPPTPVSSPLSLIGNTPVVKLRKIVPENSADIFVKLESFGLTGSYKDRMAQSMVEEAERRGALKPGMTVVEATGGSTGSSLACVCAIKGYKFRALSSDAYSEEKLRTMSAFGATVDVTHSPSGKATSDLMESMKREASSIGEMDNFFFTDQFANQDALVGYRKIGHELIAQFPDGFDAFCGTYGTAGMVMGVSSVVRSQFPGVSVTLIEPEEAALLSTGRWGEHGVDGIAPGFLSQHLDQNLYDEVRTISEQKGREVCRTLAREEGILVGTSSGLNIAAAIQLAKELGPGKKVITIACDTGLKYLAGSLFSM